MLDIKKLKIWYIMVKIFLKCLNDDILNDIIFFKKKYWDNNILNRSEIIMVNLWNWCKIVIKLWKLHQNKLKSSIIMKKI